MCADLQKHIRIQCIFLKSFNADSICIVDGMYSTQVHGYQSWIKEASGAWCNFWNLPDKKIIEWLLFEKMPLDSESFTSQSFPSLM